MKKIKENKIKLSEYHIVTIILLLFIIILLTVFKFQDRHLTFWSDQYYQYDINYEYFYHSLVNSLKEKTIPMFSWYSFLGNNFFACASQCIGDIFNPILFLMYVFGVNISILLRVETTLCIFISAWTMILFLKSQGNKNKLNIVLISIAYACGGFAAFFYGQYMFHRVFAFLPLLFYAVERFLDENSGLFFSLIVFILLLQNCYLMVPISIALIFYCLCSFKNHKKLQFKYIIKLLFYYFIGVLLSAFLILPTFIILSSNPRIGASSSFGVYHGYLLFDLGTYLDIIMDLLINTPYGIPPSQIPWDYYNLQNISGYIGFLPLVASFCGAIKNYKKYIWMIVFVILSLIPIANSMIHGFSDPTFRWLFISYFYLLCIASDYLDCEHNKKEFIIASIVFSIIYIIIINYSLCYGFVEKNSFYLSFLTEGIVAALISTVLLFKDERYAMYFTILTILVFFIKSELWSSTGYKLYQSDYYGKNNFSYINDIESDELFRIYIDPDNYGGNKIAQYNESLKYDFMAVQTYDTLSDTTIIEFLKFIDEMDNNKKIKIQDLRRLLGVKYIVTGKDLESDDYTYVMNMNNFKVFKDNKANSVGYSYFEIKEGTSKIDNLIDLNNSKKYVIGNQISFTEKGTNYFIGNIDLEKESNIIISLPNSKGWKLFADGDVVKPDSVFGGFMGFKLGGGGHILEGYYVTPGLKEGMCLSFFGTMITIVLLTKRKRSSKNYY